MPHPRDLDARSDSQPERPESVANEILEVFELIEASEGVAGSAFRVPRDAAELVIEKLEDRILDGSPPEDPLAWATTVRRNLDQSGPSRKELHRSHVREIPFAEDQLAAQAPEKLVQVDASWSRAFFARLERYLSQDEKKVLDSIREAHTWKGVATQAGMTGWEVRTRRQRIIHKAKKLLISFPPPLYLVRLDLTMIRLHAFHARSRPCNSLLCRLSPCFLPPSPWPRNRVSLR